MTSFAIIGAGGRMGSALIRCARRFDDLALAAAIDRPDHPARNKDTGVLAGIAENGIPLLSDLGNLGAVDVCIDFSFHEAVPANMAAAAESGAAIVLGTTGLDESESDAVKAAAARVPVVWAANMSLGMNVLFDMVERAAKALGLEYDAEIVEVHHRHKKDAPSGTAMTLARRLAEGRGQDLQATAVFGREGITGERPRGEIGIHALRSGDVVGDHTVSFATEGERIELTHRASNRDIFAMGALRAALWAPGKAPGLYDMKDVLGL